MLFCHASVWTISYTFYIAEMVAGSKGLNRKTVSFVMKDPDVQQRLVRELKQPMPPAQPRAERGFIRSHFPHLRLSSQGDKKQRQNSSPSQVTPEEESFNLTQQTSSFASGDDDSMGDSLSAVLLANSQPLSKRLGSLDRPPALQKTSLGVLSSHASRALLDNDGGGSMSSGPSGNTSSLCVFRSHDIVIE